MGKSEDTFGKGAGGQWRLNVKAPKTIHSTEPSFVRCIVAPLRRLFARNAGMAKVPKKGGMYVLYIWSI